MKKENCKIIVLFLVVLSFISCGGGGGGGGGGSATGVRVINGSIDAPPADIFMEGLDSSGLKAAKFSEAGSRSEITGEATKIAVRSKSSGNVLASVEVPENRDGSYSVLLFGSSLNNNLTARLLSDNNGETDGILVRVVNAVNNNAGLLVSLNGSDSLTIPFGRSSEYQKLPAGSIASVVKTLGGSVISTRTFNSGEAKSLTLLVTGEEDYLVFTRLIED